MFIDRILNRPNSMGFGLTEVLVSVFLVGLLGIVIDKMINLLHTSEQFDNLLATRNQLVVTFRQAASDPDAIIASLQLKDTNGNRINQLLYDCVCGGAGTNCETSSSSTPLLMNDPSGAPLSVYSGTAPVQMYDPGGALLSAVNFGYYDAHANRTIQSNAAFLLTATLFAECMPNFSVGDFDPPHACHGQTAEFLRIVYSLTRYPSSLNDLSPAQGSVFININQINPTAQNCL